jgi:hypothetical protein
MHACSRCWWLLAVRFSRMMSSAVHGDEGDHAGSWWWCFTSWEGSCRYDARSSRDRTLLMPAEWCASVLSTDASISTSSINTITWLNSSQLWLWHIHMSDEWMYADDIINSSVYIACSATFAACRTMLISFSYLTMAACCELADGCVNRYTGRLASQECCVFYRQQLFICGRGVLLTRLFELVFSRLGIWLLYCSRNRFVWRFDDVCSEQICCALRVRVLHIWDDWSSSICDMCSGYE